MRKTKLAYLFPLPVILLAAAAWFSLQPAQPPQATPSPEPAAPQPVLALTETLTPTFIPTSTTSLTSNPTETKTVVISETPTLSPTPSESHIIHAIGGHRQYFPLGCETAAAKDWANYFNKDFNEIKCRLI